MAGKGKFMKRNLNKTGRRKDEKEDVIGLKEKLKREITLRRRWETKIRYYITGKLYCVSSRY